MSGAIVGYTEEEGEALLAGWRERLGRPKPTPEQPGRPAGDLRQLSPLGGYQPHNLFANSALPLRLWGGPSLFTRVVPPEHVLTAVGRDGKGYALLLCVCGAQSVLEPCGFTECVGGCSRWFLWTGQKVHVHRFPLRVGD
jgi:hypothetical protein